MTEIRPPPTLPVIKDRKTSVLDDRRVIDFTRFCRVVGIIDSESGLIRSLPRSGREPES
ncbi:hypothetical protein [Bradyrhizobium sp. DASA03120]|uniref:hypothetical protein n=1 Tax=Bradyrhizobium sp. SMVTL-02 TaxID=3395917 RepID=UPI003F6F06AD